MNLLPGKQKPAWQGGSNTVVETIGAQSTTEIQDNLHLETTVSKDPTQDREELIATAGDYEPHAKGRFPATCVDVVDLGIVETLFEGQPIKRHRIRLVFVTDGSLKNGKRASIARQFTLSVNEKSALRKFLRQWFDRDLTPGEAAHFNVTTLIGQSGVIRVVHTQVSERTYANIETIEPLPLTDAAPEIGDYVRVRDRTPS
jgi:hypothetical protein